MAAPLSGCLRVGAEPAPLAVIAARGSLQHDRPATAARGGAGPAAAFSGAGLSGERDDVSEARDRPVPRAPDSLRAQRGQAAEPISHRALVLGEPKRPTARPDHAHPPNR